MFVADDYNNPITSISSPSFPFSTKIDLVLIMFNLLENENYYIVTSIENNKSEKIMEIKTIFNSKDLNLNVSSISLNTFSTIFRLNLEGVAFPFDSPGDYLKISCELKTYDHQNLDYNKTYLAGVKNV